MIQQQRDIILVTGMSGAGKTTAMSIFEDMGYLIIDNLPVELIVAFSEIWMEGSAIPYKKVVMAVRMFDLPTFINNSELQALNPRVVFLNCSDDELRRRYKYNRRIHPMIISNQATTIDEAIEYERNIFNTHEDFANITVDTTFTKKSDLIDIFEHQLDFKFYFSTKIVFQSFGYRYGIPLDADYVFDVRFLDNPFYDKSLRLLTGKNEEVYEAVLNDEKTKPFLEKLIELLDIVIKHNLEMDRGVINIAIGCTGGQHRSVVIARHLTQIYLSSRSTHIAQQSDQKLDIVSYHRDIEKNLKDVYDRHHQRVEKIYD